MKLYTLAGLLLVACSSMAGPKEDILYNSIQLNDLPGVQSALREGADPNFQLRFEGIPDTHSVWYSTPLIEASLRSSPSQIMIVKALVAAGAAPSSKIEDHTDSNQKQWAYSAMMAAANNGFSDVVGFLIQKGADVNQVTFGECPVTALWLASYTGRADVVRGLIAARAEINFRGGCRNQTPLGIAKDYGRLDIVKILQGAGAKE